MSIENSKLTELTERLAQSVAILTLPSSVDRSTLDTMRLILDEAAEEGVAEYRNNGSYEQIAQIIEESSTVARLDVLNFWEQVAFAWVAGCSDMGHQSFAFHQPHKGLYALAPAYDLVPTAILYPTSEPHDELKLTLNRKRRAITRADFEAAMKRSGLKAKIINGIFSRFSTTLDAWIKMVDSAEISSELKERYKTLLIQRVGA